MLCKKTNIDFFEVDNVSINGKGKELLIPDLRHVNKQVVLNKIKFENWITLKQYVTKGGFGFVFLTQIGIPPHRYFSRK